MAGEYGGGALRFLYRTVPGRILLKYVAAAPWFSEWRAHFQKSPRSRKKIEPFINRYQIDLTDGGFGEGWELSDFDSFNDFFTRKRSYDSYFRDMERAGVLASSGQLPAIADASLSVYPITDDLRVPIKETTYSVEELTGGHSRNSFRAGHCLIFRLGLTDYHRYCFPDDGRLSDTWELPGALHTVRPVAEPYRIYSRNKRTVSVLETTHFGSIVMVEVGAMLVGHIVNHELQGDNFAALEEKGYFEFGGSTIVLLLGPEVKVAERYLENTRNGIETHVRMGETIEI